MITGEIKNKADKIWTDIWSGGITKQLRAVMGNAAIKIILKPDGESYKDLLAHLGVDDSNQA
ncbi:MAG: hypothetical protein IKI45_18935 [Oscillospiraceae bacterium]|nr:hypothetical protein [Oscillospiraceae bacterium]